MAFDLLPVERNIREKINLRLIYISHYCKLEVEKRAIKSLPTSPRLSLSSDISK